MESLSCYGLHRQGRKNRHLRFGIERYYDIAFYYSDQAFLKLDCLVWRQLTAQTERSPRAFQVYEAERLLDDFIGKVLRRQGRSEYPEMAIDSEEDGTDEIEGEDKEFSLSTKHTAR